MNEVVAVARGMLVAGEQPFEELALLAVTTITSSMMLIDTD